MTIETAPMSPHRRVGCCTAARQPAAAPITAPNTSQAIRAAIGAPIPRCSIMNEPCIGSGGLKAEGAAAPADGKTIPRRGMTTAPAMAQHATP
ncbi:MAG: hypothetical protein E6I45_12435 [Chloroflexi bacterium]|nr:MAG: hypothetical protein E6I45_12435 [Chloroflexota bacterium]